MADKAESRLLSLPPELRNNIYELVFTDNIVDFNTNSYPAPPGLLLSCKQIYSEAISVHYATSSFISNDWPKVFASHLKKLPAKFLQHHQDIVLDVNDNQRYDPCNRFEVNDDQKGNSRNRAKRAAVAARNSSWLLERLIKSALWSQSRFFAFREALEQHGLRHLLPKVRMSVVLDNGETIVHTQTPWQTFYNIFATGEFEEDEDAGDSEDSEDSEDIAMEQWLYPHLLDFFNREHKSASNCWSAWRNLRDDHFRCKCPAVRDPVHNRDEHSSEESAA